MNELLMIEKISQFTIGESFLEIIYLFGSIMFVYGLKMLSKPDTARAGNLWAAFGMVLAIIFTVWLHKFHGIGISNVPLILLAIAIGTFIGWYVAVKVKMTAMPQLVSFFNGMGGACAGLIAVMEYPHIVASEAVPYGEVIAILLGMVIGTVAFTGSMIAFGKLNDNIRDIRAPYLKIINLIILAVIAILIVYIMVSAEGSVLADGKLDPTFTYILLAVAFVYGVTFVMPIGGADMPVVVSLLNSFTGVAAAFGGFLYGNQIMLTGGILVGSAGMILTLLMCQAMNRPFINVIVGQFGGGGAGGPEDEMGTIKEITPSDAAVLLAYSSKVVIVPGYGLAVAQAQHICHEFERLIEEKGAEVKYAVHPVAGRMPGHMNVLMAEADVSYDKLVEMDDINPDMPNTDVVLVIGANDVVNPAAETDPSSPIYGMPIIKTHLAKNVIIMKRGMGKGYAAIENALFYKDKTRMLFGNAKDSLQKLVGELKEL
jgi:H+-translocating NAD(P) transhydrogenase subunit beta